MQKKVLDLNTGKYDFNLSVISDFEWEDIATGIVLTKGEYSSDLELLSFKVKILDNKAKFKICFQDSSYHEHEYHLDEFGRCSKHYRDYVSFLLQEVMTAHYGTNYTSALSAKLDLNTNQTD